MAVTRSKTNPGGKPSQDKQDAAHLRLNISKIKVSLANAKTEHSTEVVALRQQIALLEEVINQNEQQLAHMASQPVRAPAFPALGAVAIERKAALTDKKRQMENLVSWLQTRNQIDDVKVARAQDELAVIVQELDVLEESIILTETKQDERRRVAKSTRAAKEDSTFAMAMAKEAADTAQAEYLKRQYMQAVLDLGTMPSASVIPPTVIPLQSCDELLAEGMSLLQVFVDE